MSTNTIEKWAGPAPDRLIGSVFKKNAPALQPGERLLRVDFGIHGYFYVIIESRGRDGECIKLQDGWLPVWRFHLVTPGAVIGPHDIQVANHRPWGHEWRAAVMDRISYRYAAAGKGEA